jgi:hypothetical protein
VAAETAAAETAAAETAAKTAAGTAAAAALVSIVRTRALFFAAESDCNVNQMSKALLVNPLKLGNFETSLPSSASGSVGPNAYRYLWDKIAK